MAEAVDGKALLLIADTANGGLGAAVRAEAEWFSTRGWSVTIAAPDEIVTEAPVTFRTLGIPYRTREVRGLVRAGQRARRLLGEIEPSVVHAHGTRSLLVARLAGARAYLTLHGLPWAHSRLGATLRRVVVSASGALARKAFSVSPELNGGRWRFIAHASPRLADLDQLEFSPSVPPMFLWLGDATLLKRPEVFVEALAEAARVKPMCGMIVGSGPQIASVASLAKRLDAPVTMVPFTKDVAPLYACCTAVVLTSASEGIPFVLEEAMWCGRAVIATDLPGTRWLMGETGRLVRSESELVDALIELSDNNVAMRSGRQCRAQVRRLLAADSPWPHIEQEFLNGLLL